MTSEQIKMVQDSFRKVMPISGAAADLFYDRLFEIAAEVRSLFPDDLVTQTRLPRSFPRSKNLANVTPNI